MSVWPHEDLAGDFEEALRTGETRAVGVGGQALPNVAPDDVAEVVEWYVSYHGQGRWQPGMEVGTELNLHAVLRLRDGRWATIVASNDYTGWGCQDEARVRIAPNRVTAIWSGLDNASRGLLGFPESRVPGWTISEETESDG